MFCLSVVCFLFCVFVRHGMPLKDAWSEEVKEKVREKCILKTIHKLDVVDGKCVESTLVF